VLNEAGRRVVCSGAVLVSARGAGENGCWAAVERLPEDPPLAAEPGIVDGRPSPAEAFAAEPDTIRAAVLVGAVAAAAAAATAPAIPATPEPAPDDPTVRCSPAERRPTCDAPSRAGVAADPDPAVEPAADAGARGAVAGSRNHPAGATGSAGIHAVLSAFCKCLCVVVCVGICRAAWRGGVATDVRSTGSACAGWLCGFTAPARQFAPAPRAAAALAAAAPAAPAAAAALRPFAGGRQRVGRA
jgi:hypothetical protein